MTTSSVRAATTRHGGKCGRVFILPEFAPLHLRYAYYFHADAQADARAVGKPGIPRRPPSSSSRRRGRCAGADAGTRRPGVLVSGVSSRGLREYVESKTFVAAGPPSSGTYVCGSAGSAAAAAAVTNRRRHRPTSEVATADEAAGAASPSRAFRRRRDVADKAASDAGVTRQRQPRPSARPRGLAADAAADGGSRPKKNKKTANGRSSLSASASASAAPRRLLLGVSKARGPRLQASAPPAPSRGRGPSRGRSSAASAPPRHPGRAPVGKI